MKNEILIGTWLLDGRRCRLVGRTDWKNGKGHGRLATQKDPYALIEVGLAGDWVECLDGLLHEALELVICAHGWEWGSPIAAMHQDAGTRLVVMTHEQYQEAVRTATDFLMMALSGDRLFERTWCRFNKVRISR